MAKHNLAIVIPAYKVNYLDQTLDSIANQTCKDFTLYIGNDASPYDVESIVDKYRKCINIVYKRFDDNIGGNDLVAQWERCIALTQNEPWIWLFSDDDMMDPTCVEAFYKGLKQEPQLDLYRFNVNIINKDNKIISRCRAIKDIMTSEEIYYAKQKGIMNSFVVEYMFSRDVYNRNRGFLNFDLAWNSDIATWMKFGKEKGIRTISDTFISWRSSGENITTKVDKVLEKRKFKADMEFLGWLNCEFSNSRMRWFNLILRLKFIIIYSWSNIYKVSK